MMFGGVWLVAMAIVGPLIDGGSDAPNFLLNGANQ